MSDQRVRSLRFAVTTSLLAVPVLAGCRPEHTNVSPVETSHESPSDDPSAPTTDGTTPAEPVADPGAGDGEELEHTNTAPTPEPKPPTVVTNPAPVQPPKPG